MHRAVPTKCIALLLCLGLLLPLASCHLRRTPAAEDPAETPAPTAAPWKPETIPAIAGEESAAPQTPGDPPDGLEGSYYNDFTRETLTLDGYGQCALSWPGGVMGGTYSRTETGFTVQMAELRLEVYVDPQGDLAVAGRRGAFLRDWDFWGITPAEAGIHPTSSLPDTEEFSLGGGAYRYRDFAAGLALTYSGNMQILSGRLADAVTVADGRGGYVIGRAVTRRWVTRGGSAEEFLEDYIRSAVFADFEALYGPVIGYEGLNILKKGAGDGRLAAGEITLRSAQRSAVARVILFSSAFADGTESILAKCVLAPTAEEADALAESVRDMAAARVVLVS